MEHLLTVEDTFLIENRGLIVVPGPTIDEFPNACEFEAELRLSHGTRRPVVVSLQYAFFHPPSTENRYCCIVTGIGKEDVPIGSEIWFTPCTAD